MKFKILIIFISLFLFAQGADATKQVIVGGTSQSLYTTSVKYTSLMGTSQLWLSSNVGVRQVFPTRANLYYFRVYLTTAPGAGKSYTFNIHTGISDTPISVTISGTDTTGQDMEHAFAALPNHRFNIKCTPSGTPAASTARWSITSDSVISGETILMAGTTQSLNAVSGNYAMVGSTVRNAIGFRREILIPSNGTLTKFYVKMDAVPGSGGDNYRFIVVHNTAISALDMTFTNSTSSGNDQDTVSVSAGDAIVLGVIRGGPDPVETTFSWGVVFIPDTEGEFIIPMSSDTLTSVYPKYAQMTSGDDTFSVTEANHQQLASAMTIKRIYAEKDSANAFPKGWTFQLRVNGANSSPALTVGLITAVTLNSEDADVSISDDDLLNTKIEDFGVNPAGKYVHVSYLGFIEPETVGFGDNF